MIVEGTPVEYHGEFDLWVKREDLACPDPGPPFSKTRGVWAHIKKRPEALIGVLDTAHSQAGHAVALACKLTGKECLNFWPRHKKFPAGELRPPQQRSRALGSKLYELPATASWHLYIQARRITEDEYGGYMMPNALKLPETVEETAREVGRTEFPAVDTIVVSTSSGTIAAGVLKGLVQVKQLYPAPRLILHMGYQRTESSVRKYVAHAAGVYSYPIEIVDEGYAYKDVARPGPTPTWPCNPWYDLKAFRWLMGLQDRSKLGRTLLWNIG